MICTQLSFAKKSNGKLVGVLFTDPLNATKPPFGATKEEYNALFEPYFKFKTFEVCNNSIKPREGRELFIDLIKYLFIKEYE